MARHIRFKPAGKPPKLRWKPGSFILVCGQLFEILYAYRLQDDPHEWHFCCEEREVPSSTPKDAIGQYLKALGCGSTTPRIVYELFRDCGDAWRYFADIPANGNRSDFSNRTLIKEAKLISSGEVI